MKMRLESNLDTFPDKASRRRTQLAENSDVCFFECAHKCVYFIGRPTTMVVVVVLKPLLLLAALTAAVSPLRGARR